MVDLVEAFQTQHKNGKLINVQDISKSIGDIVDGITEAINAFDPDDKESVNTGRDATKALISGSAAFLDIVLADPAILKIIGLGQVSPKNGTNQTS